MILRCALQLIATLLLCVSAYAEDVYIIDPPRNAIGARKEHEMLLLRAALDASEPKYGPYSLQVSTHAMERERLQVELLTGQQVNITVAAANHDWEKKATPIRVPIDKGLYGYRVALIDGRRQAEFSQLRDVSELQHLLLGVGDQWVTRTIYEKGGFHTVPGNNYFGLFGMLMAGRFDFMPRSVEEATLDLAALTPRYPDMVLEQSFVLVSVIPRYFFVSPAKPRLAERLRYGMKKLIDSGAFDTIFTDYYGPMIAKAGLCERRVFRIDNHDLTPETRALPSKFWFDPFHAPGSTHCQADNAAPGK